MGRREDSGVVTAARAGQRHLARDDIMNKSRVHQFIAASLSLAAALVGCTTEPDPRNLEKETALGSVNQPLGVRRGLSKTKPQRPKAKHRLVVKFRDDLRVRATKSGGVQSDVKSPAALGNTSALSQLAQRSGMRFSQLIQLPEQRLETLRTRAALASKLQQPDLAGILVVDVPEARLQAAAEELYASSLTELVYFQERTPPPPQTCVDIAPPTPSYVSLQGYRDANPGVNMTAAWTLGPARGAGIKIADCEYGFRQAHEDLCGVTMEPGQTPHPDVTTNGWDQHGTAVLGELIGRDNGYGCTGLTPDATPSFFPEWTVEEGGRRVTAVANAIASVGAGDVVLLEMQAGLNGGGYGPAELDPALWLVVKSGTDAGVIVVGAAGNGAQDLDSSFYDEYRSRGDSGAIIVGAGSANTAHQPLGFSTYGARVNVQGWGESVVSSGYGDLAQLGGDVNQSYTSFFSGTSSASPIVAASVVSLQSYAVSSLGRRLTPLEMRSLLVDTGTPQGAGVHIGPLPNVVAAIQQLDSGETPFCGDGTCNASETCQTCASDCGACPSCVPQGCSNATPVTIPYAADGAVNTCVFFSAPSSHVNSWNMSSVELNGVDVTNLWVGTANYPAACNGGYYLRAVGNFSWSHVEAQ
jgi:serine protease